MDNSNPMVLARDTANDVCIVAQCRPMAKSWPFGPIDIRLTYVHTSTEYCAVQCTTYRLKWKKKSRKEKKKTTDRREQEKPVDNKQLVRLPTHVYFIYLTIKIMIPVTGSKSYYCTRYILLLPCFVHCAVPIVSMSNLFSFYFAAEIQKVFEKKTYDDENQRFTCRNTGRLAWCCCW